MRSIRTFFKEHGLSISIFLAGMIFGIIMIHVNGIEIEQKITISDVLSMLVTTIVGVYLATTISKNQSANRYEKDFLISETKKVLEMMHSESVFTDTQQFDKDVTAKAFKRLNILLHNLETLFPLSEHCSFIETSALRSEFKNLRRLMTGIPSKSNIIHPDNQQRMLIASAITLFKRKLFSTIIDINK
jgi:hypothetical protein